MSGNWDIDVDHEDYEDAPRALRDAYKQLKKQYTTATAERDDFKSKWESKSASDALAGYGFKNSKRVSRDLIADGVDLSDTDAVKAWVAENGDDYAKGEGAQVQQTEDQSAEAQQRETIQDAAAQLRPTGGDKMQAAAAEIPADATPEQVLAIFQKHGI